MILRASILLGLTCVALPASAAPWAEVGDAQLRSDIEILASAGVIDDVTTQWPLPWGGVLYRLEAPDALDGQPDYVKEAAERVEEAGERETHADRLNATVTSDFTNLPDVVRGFDALGREDIQGQAAVEWTGETTAIRLQLGAQSINRRDHQIFVPDGSYALQRIGNAAVYAGYVTHWWGPGWTSALSLSNNARPFPHIGITRIDTSPFESSWLRWIGPWQAEFLVGVLDGKRIARNTLFDALRISLNPVPGLEISLARLQQLCGTGHPCSPFSEFVNVQNNPRNQSKSKDEADIDLRYTNTLWGASYAVYTQFMNRDTGPFVHSDTSHLFGASVWTPLEGTPVRFTAEYANTISTREFFSFGEYFYGLTYTDFKYPDGWQYRDRTLGASLDTDSRLATLQSSWQDARGWTYTLTYYNAAISSPQTPPGINIVTTSPVTIDIGEARLHLPFEGLALDVAMRIQDDQPRPDKGFTAAGELGLNWAL